MQFRSYFQLTPSCFQLLLQSRIFLHCGHRKCSLRFVRILWVLIPNSAGFSRCFANENSQCCGPKWCGNKSLQPLSGLSKTLSLFFVSNYLTYLVKKTAQYEGIFSKNRSESGRDNCMVNLVLFDTRESNGTFVWYFWPCAFLTVAMLAAIFCFPLLTIVSCLTLRKLILLSLKLRATNKTRQWFKSVLHSTLDISICISCIKLCFYVYSLRENYFVLFLEQCLRCVCWTVVQNWRRLVRKSSMWSFKSLSLAPAHNCSFIPKTDKPPAKYG